PGAKAAVPADDAAAENADDAAAPVNFQPYDVMEEDRLAAIVPGPEDVTGGNMRVVQITGFHYHNPPKKAGRVDAKLAAKDTDVKASDGEAVYLRKTLLYNLKHGTVVLPSSGEAITMKELGVSYPVLIDTPEAEPVSIIHPVLQPLVDAGAVTDTGGGSRGSRGERGYDSDDRDYRANSKQGKAAETLADHAKKLGVPERLSLRRFDFVIQFAWVETPPSVRDKKKENDGKKAEANVAGADTEEKK
ncbi:MAG: hypothetical protein LBT89_01220, partial [Planctomycetaceae bacterium]|nr:hypothetical protein [Planctomycetaceae bacterium]